MATNFYISANNSLSAYQDAVLVDTKKTYSFDFGAWVEDNSAITGVTWTLKSGSATISGEVLASSVASALVTCADAGRSKIEVKATTAAEVFIAVLDILAKEIADEDYGYG